MEYRRQSDGDGKKDDGKTKVKIEIIPSYLIK
jgi:hypothetical protein